MTKNQKLYKDIVWLNIAKNHKTIFKFLYNLYRKLVVVCSRASLCDNCRIFQFTFTSKPGVAWVVYTREFLDWQTLESLQIGIETDLDEFKTITIFAVTGGPRYSRGFRYQKFLRIRKPRITRNHCFGILLSILP